MTGRAAIILAAGSGGRMLSDTPKGLHLLGGRTLLDWSLALAKDLSCSPILLVGSPDGESLFAAAGDRAIPCVQERACGTADAVRAAAAKLRDFSGEIIILYVDTPLISPQTGEKLLAALDRHIALAVLGFEPEDPGQYGRLITGADGMVARIVEAADASEQESRTGLCNSGIMAGSWPVMRNWLDRVGNDNARQEYYLTDLVGIAREDGHATAVVRACCQEVMGINTRLEQAMVEAAFQAQMRRRVMSLGVHLLAPDTVSFSWDTDLAPGCVVEPYVVFGPRVRVGRDSLIRSFSYLEQTMIAPECHIGPYARLRRGARLDKGVGIGNFVEVKDAHIGAGSKAGHLSYIGDGEIGRGVNIGAGSIFCNYDGHDKHVTKIGDNVFIGSNSSLVAPVIIGDNAYIGSGSVIVEDVAADSLALARARQTGKKGWVSRFRARLAGKER